MNARGTLRSGWAAGCAFSVSAVVFVLGCASPGTPKPPSLHLPEVVSDLTAERIGETVRLRWTTPEKTTDGLKVENTVTAQVCRQVPHAATKCLPMRRLVVHPGPSELVDVLPAALLEAAGTVLLYRLELLNARERSAGLSVPVPVAGGPAPPPVVSLQAEATRAGALLRWHPEDAADAVELERLPLTSATQTRKRSMNAGHDTRESTPVRLRSDHAGLTSTPFIADAGGMVDATAARGESYAYTAQRVRRVLLNGHALELHSAVSPPVAVTMRDVFPPQAPREVEAIAGMAGGVLGIDLSWTPNTEDDLAGYIVYRREGGEADNVRITSSLVLQPAFRDTGMAAGHGYVYTVTAVDRAGNESAPSAPARESTPLP